MTETTAGLVAFVCYLGFVLALLRLAKDVSFFQSPVRSLMEEMKAAEEPYVKFLYAGLIALWFIFGGTAFAGLVASGFAVIASFFKLLGPEELNIIRGILQDVFQFVKELRN